MVEDTTGVWVSLGDPLEVDVEAGHVEAQFEATVSTPRIGQQPSARGTSSRFSRSDEVDDVEFPLVAGLLVVDGGRFGGLGA